MGSRRTSPHRHELVPAADVLAMSGRKVAIALTIDGWRRVVTDPNEHTGESYPRESLFAEDVECEMAKHTRVRVYNRARRCCWDSLDGGHVA